ncbi:MAG: ribonuclease Z [Polyangiales bacterium]
MANPRGPPMSVREIVALGTASQVPTRLRNHNGYFLRWDDEGFLFDPGEGTQRQMAFASLAASSIHRVCVTHFHGDHCLGLGGIIQRASLDRVPHPVHIHFPSSGTQYFERLRYASIYYPAAEIVPSPVRELPLLQVIADTPNYTLYAHALEHGVPTIGYRLEEKAGRRFDPALLAAAGVAGPHVGALAKKGSIEIHGRTVTVDEVSHVRLGAVVAFVMDTRPCPGATALARDADLLVMEATYTAEDQSLATEHGHSSSADAARTALEANAKQLAITHFSQRYASTEQHVREARAIFENTIALHDLDRLVIPRRK